jgi:hypothetical protein
MTTLEKITPDMFPQIYQNFFIEDDPESSQKDWERLFNYNYIKEEDHTGYVLVDNSVIVGVMGMIFSKRIIQGKEQKFCNLHNWHVKENYRGRSLLMMKPLLGLKDYTVTDFTPTDRVSAISEKLGFEELDSTLRIFLPVPQYKRFDGQGSTQLPIQKKYQIISNLETIEGVLNGRELRIFHDHRDYESGHMLIRCRESQSEFCYILYSRVNRYIKPYCHIHYISNPDIFEKANRLIRYHLERLNDCSFSVIENRLVSNNSFSFSLKFPIRNRQNYRSSHLRPEHIDTLYSEVTFLKLCTFPDISKMVGRWLKNFRFTSQRKTKK